MTQLDTATSSVAYPQIPEPLDLEWVSDGSENIDVFAWHLGVMKQHAGKGASSTLGSWLIMALCLILGATLILLGASSASNLQMLLGVWTLLIGVLSLYRLISLKLNPARASRNTFVKAHRSGMLESTEGRWRCRIGDGRIEYEWLDRGHLISTPSCEITELATVAGRVVLLAGLYVRGHLPAGAVPGDDPTSRVWAALRHPVQS